MDYTHLNPQTRALWERGCRRLVGGGQGHKRHTRYIARGGPGFFTRAKGACMWDADGRRFIDYLCGYGPIILGHCDDAWNAAVLRQMQEAGVQSAEHPSELALADRLAGLIPNAEMLLFAIGGSAATSTALRIARAHTGREAVIRCGYHGWHDWAMSDTNGVPLHERAFVHAVAYNDVAGLERLLKQLPRKVAAVIVEAVLDDGPAPGYFDAVRRLCDEHGCLFILDEVKTGFRFDLGGAQRLYGIRPDLATYGKAMANGLPISAICGTRQVMEQRADLAISATFHGDPIGCAAALATLDELERRDGIAFLHRQGRALIDGLNRIFAAADFPMHLAGHPAMPNPTEGWRGQTQRALPKGWAGEAARAWCAAMQRRGVFVNLHVWFLTLAHDDAIIAETLAKAEEAIPEALRDLPA
jgi:glutamate-1-semialdehyde aminotransferase